MALPLAPPSLLPGASISTVLYMTAKNAVRSEAMMIVYSSRLAIKHWFAALSS